ncbi:MAG: transposase [Acetobacteraceae bacterium]|nr:transposase [Acetobacteraceae bacterium]
MAEAFVKTFKRNYARVNPCSNAATVLRHLEGWFDHDNTVHPHKSLGYRSPRRFRAELWASKETECSLLGLKQAPVLRPGLTRRHRRAQAAGILVGRGQVARERGLLQAMRASGLAMR